METAYHCAAVTVDPARPDGRVLWLNSARHSYVDLADPLHLEFAYAQWIAAAAPAPVDVLHLGGGGFTLPRYYLARGARETVHVLAFGPKPMLVQVEMAPAGDERISAGERRVSATHFVLTPKLGLVRGTIARIIGKNPAPYHCWIVTGDVPAFVNIDGALFPGGPVWRIETVSPRPPARGSAGR